MAAELVTMPCDKQTSSRRHITVTLITTDTTPDHSYTAEKIDFPCVHMSHDHQSMTSSKYVGRAILQFRPHLTGCQTEPRLQEFIADPTQDMDQREWIWQHYGILAVWCREGGSLRFSWFPGTALRSMYTLYEITFAGHLDCVHALFPAGEITGVACRLVRNWPTYARPVIDGVFLSARRKQFQT